jgi:hypothetical protein
MGKQRDGFKKGRRMLTLGFKIQSLIARALEKEYHEIMASLVLSAAFEVVNIPLLIERLQIIGVPVAILDLI